MKSKILTIVVLFVLLFKTEIKACTSFVIYTQTDTFYCMNWDYPDRIMNFNLSDIGIDTTLLKIGFYENSTLCYFIGYNTLGNVATWQQLSPGFNLCTQQPNITLWDAWNYYLNNFSSINDFNNFLTATNNTIVKVEQLPYDYHVLMADKNKNAIIIEPINTGHEITSMENDFQVMANFPNYQFVGQPYNSVTGLGASRYISTCEYILNHFDNFTLDNSFEALQTSLQTSGSYKTQCSLIINPNKNEVYIVLNRDFEHIWKLTITNRTIETYQGFSNNQTLTIENDGVSDTDLLGMITNIQEVNSTKSKISISPNPARDFITISGIQDIKKVYIYDITGKLLITDYNFILNINSLQKGIYFLKITDLNGKNFTEKIVKQ